MQTTVRKSATIRHSARSPDEPYQWLMGETEKSSIFYDDWYVMVSLFFEPELIVVGSFLFKRCLVSQPPAKRRSPHPSST